MAMKKFKAESKRLLDLMINSIYTHKEIFLRELISNANDAIDKLYFRSLTDKSVNMAREDFKILITADKDKRTLTISDNGCGMTKEDLENHLGTIAESGSLAFKQQNEKLEDIDVIGQFGVGFYSAFMVSDKVTVISRAFGSEQSYCWESEGADGYTVTDAAKDSFGTDIILQIKQDTEDEKYGEYLDSYQIRALVKKYSDYIRYPIQMDIEKSRPKADNDKESETYIERETLNSMVPLWKRAKSELKDEDYNQFYQDKFYDYEAPLKTIHTSVEGVTSYNALLFVPQKAPYNYYSKSYEKGLQLYSNGVLIMDKCADLLPDCYSFVRGLVDSQDLSLNISREMLQHNRQLKVIAQSIEKKIKAELLKMQSEERETYDNFYKSFGLQLKAGVYSDYGMNKDKLKELLMFYSSTEQKNVTLAEYVSRMKEGQEFIYYACGGTVEKIDKLPQTELVKDKGFEILYLTEDIDEFVMRILETYDEKKFKSVSAKDLNLETEEEKKESEKQADENKDLFALMTETLAGKVKAVRLSTRLKNHAVCLTTDGEVSLEMEKVLNSMPNANEIKADRVLELNPAHAVFATLQSLYETDKDKVKEYSYLLYTQALLIEGLPVDDPVEFSNAVCKLMR